MIRREGERERERERGRDMIVILCIHVHTVYQCSPQAKLRHDRRVWCRWSLSHMKTFGLSLFPTSKGILY